MHQAGKPIWALKTMSSTTTDQQYLNTSATLPEPHFDEEATVLSAQPVVPLDEVKATKSGAAFSRPWILGLSVAGALLVGVLATALYFSRSSDENLSALEGIDVVSGVAGVSDESFNGFSGPASSQPKVETSEAAVMKPAEVRQPVRVSNDSDKKPQPRLVAVIKEKNNDDQDSLEDRKAARRQARRERRREDRERRSGKSSDELLRIRDIFEGSPRP